MTTLDNNFSLLEQPHEQDYLWRYFKSFDRLKDFLSGKIHLSPLASFDDYLESITPVHYYLIQLLNNWTILNHNKAFEKKLFFDFKNLVERFELNWIKDNLRRVWELEDETNLDNMIKITFEKLIEILKQHNEYQNRVYTSCWLINNSYDEDYLMWKSYSAPGGFAIRIQFKQFSDLLKKSLELEENKHFLDTTITKSFQTGKIKYNYLLHGADWIRDVKKNIPLSFFKHTSYKHEKEFRICAEFLKPNSELNRIFFYDFMLWGHCEIILHPSSFFNDYEKYAALFKEHNINQRIKFSTFNCRKLE